MLQSIVYTLEFRINYTTYFYAIFEIYLEKLIIVKIFRGGKLYYAAEYSVY